MSKMNKLVKGQQGLVVSPLPCPDPPLGLPRPKWVKDTFRCVLYKAEVLRGRQVAWGATYLPGAHPGSESC